MLAVVVVGLYLQRAHGILFGALVDLAVVVMGDKMVVDQQEHFQLAEEVEVLVALAPLVHQEATVVPE
jgi:hypothetical protein